MDHPDLITGGSQSLLDPSEVEKKKLELNELINSSIEKTSHSVLKSDLSQFKNHMDKYGTGCLMTAKKLIEKTKECEKVSLQYCADLKTTQEITEAKMLKKKERLKLTREKTYSNIWFSNRNALLNIIQDRFDVDPSTSLKKCKSQML
jgi:hypothetical protein